MGVGAPHLHEVALKDGEVAQLVELATQEVALEAPRATRGVDWKQAVVCRSEGLASTPGDQVRVPRQGAQARQRPSHCQPHAFLAPSPGPTPPGKTSLTSHPIRTGLTCTTWDRFKIAPALHRHAPALGGNAGWSLDRLLRGGA